MTVQVAAPGELAKMTEWSLDFRQIEPGEMETIFAVRADKGASLGRIKMNRAVHQIGQSPAGMLTFGIASSGNLRSWMGAERLDGKEDRTLLCFGDGAEFESVSTSDHDGIVMSFSAAEAERLIAMADLAIPALAVRAGSLEANGRQIAACRDMAQHLLGPGADGRPAGWDEEVLFRALSAAHDRPADGSACKAPSRRALYLRRALECMEAEADEPLSVAEICVRTGTSWRTLDRAFRDRFGFGPKRYYLRLRLNRVRSLLLSRSVPSVADAANRWGFWHMGQFARDYRALFGELPSATLGRVLH